MTLTPPLVVQLADVDAERVRNNHEQRIRELSELPGARSKIIPNVSLADGVESPVIHNLGRIPNFVTTSVPRGPNTTGRIEEVRASGAIHDPKQRVILKATGWGATITVDVKVE